jgi:hypothetical protein
MALSFLYGVIGGILGELLKWYALRESANLPTYLRSVFYWVITVLMVLAGGGLALLQGVDPSNPWLGINVGITAPLILKAFASAVPVQPPSQGGVSFEPKSAPPPNLVNFYAGR